MNVSFLRGTLRTVHCFQERRDGMLGGVSMFLRIKSLFYCVVSDAQSRKAQELELVLPLYCAYRRRLTIKRVVHEMVSHYAYTTHDWWSSWAESFPVVCRSV